MAEHTPGPWSVEIEDHQAPSDWYAAAIGVGSPWSGNYRTLARLPQADQGWDSAVRERGEADARLIAAAPELLAAVELAQWLLDRVAGWEGEGEPITKFAAKAHGDQMRAAIAKAGSDGGLANRRAGGGI